MPDWTQGLGNRSSEKRGFTTPRRCDADRAGLAISQTFFLDSHRNRSSASEEVRKRLVLAAGHDLQRPVQRLRLPAMPIDPVEDHGRRRQLAEPLLNRDPS